MSIAILIQIVLIQKSKLDTEVSQLFLSQIQYRRDSLFAQWCYRINILFKKYNWYYVYCGWPRVFVYLYICILIYEMYLSTLFPIYLEIKVI